MYPYACFVLPETVSFIQCHRCEHHFCRHCKDAPHGNATCDQAKASKVISAKTRVADTLTAAVVRECPGCKMPFQKLDGDGYNEITCRNANCGALSCYICRKQIYGQGHFCLTTNCTHEQCGKCGLFAKVEGADRKDREQIVEQQPISEDAEAAAIGALLSPPRLRPAAAPSRPPRTPLSPPRTPRHQVARRHFVATALDNRRAHPLPAFCTKMLLHSPCGKQSTRSHVQSTITLTI